MTEEDKINYKDVDWRRFFTLVEGVGTDLDKHKNRFDKADIFEQALEEYSQKKYRWDDEIGYDHFFLPTQEKFEVKSQKHVLYSEKGTPKERTKEIKLTNTLGDSSNRIFPRRFDYLMTLDTGSAQSYSVGIVKWEIVNKYVKHTGDGWSVQIPRSEIIFLCQPSDIKLSQSSRPIINYSHQKKQMQSDFVKGIL